MTLLSGSAVVVNACEWVVDGINWTYVRSITGSKVITTGSPMAREVRGSICGLKATSRESGLPIRMATGREKIADKVQPRAAGLFA